MIAPTAKRAGMGTRSVFARLSRAELEVMAEAGDEVVDCVRVLAKTGDNIVGELLNTEDKFFEWDHYPEGDVYDPETHAQYYYHAHSAGEQAVEHGHFHTFLRPKGMPRGIRPVALPDRTEPGDENEALSHLVALSMDKFGLPVRLFTTNRWVTGETWYAARDVVRMVERFEIDLARPSWPVNRWLGAMLRLFRPQIATLLEQRDAALAAWARRHPGRNVYEAKELEVTSEIAISVDVQIRAVRSALKRS